MPVQGGKNDKINVKDHGEKNRPVKGQSNNAIPEVPPLFRTVRRHVVEEDVRTIP